MRAQQLICSIICLCLALLSWWRLNLEQNLLTFRAAPHQDQLHLQCSQYIGALSHTELLTAASSFQQA